MLPIETATLFAFILAAGAIVMSPGPDTMLIIRHTLTSGQKTGLATVLGVQLGLLVHTALAVAGVSVIIASSPLLFRLVAVAGAAYLGWLGAQGLRGGGSLSINGTGAAVKPKRRIPTRPTLGSKKRRLKAKKTRGEVKSLRGKVDPDV